MNPTTTGYFLFSGTRAVGSTNQVRRLHEPVAIVEVYNRRGCELAVKLIGRQLAIRIDAFDGEWTPLELEP